MARSRQEVEPWKYGQSESKANLSLISGGKVNHFFVIEFWRNSETINIIKLPEQEGICCPSVKFDEFPESER